jgi:outer membrane protein OmpA-like peptidoglycan-associated protein
MRPGQRWALSLLLAAASAHAQHSAKLEDYTRKLQLAPGLVIVGAIYGGHDGITGKLIGDYECIWTVDRLSADGIDFSWSLTNPANMRGQRRVLTDDLRKSHKVSVYTWSGESGPHAGYSVFLRISDAIYADLKAGRKTTFEFDGNENPMTIQKVGEEDLVVLVNERKVRLHTLKGKSGNGWTEWVLDNPGFPAIVKMDGSWSWVLTSFAYPDASAKNLLDQLEKSGVATTHAVLFAFNSAELSAESKPILNVLAEHMKAHPTVAIRVEGHTDNIGGAPFNLELSRNRAVSVKQYLVAQGVAAERLGTEGLGLSQPVADNSTPEGRAQNRRVVFREAHPK